MSYQVLARKWRPKDFGELVGQQQTAQALINALTNQRLHHAYLFTGTRGVGKTTIARILSKSLNCDLGITPNPCGTCSSCTEIAQGNFVDLLEIDAASKTKVEDTRELLDNVQYRPTRGRYKVYLIDEVHMLSGHSFNALLKTLEEPPPHVIFLLATTDPQKLPVTVLSRCLQFHLRRMELDEITTHLAKILAAEQLKFEAGALQAIAKGADGSMRDALSLLDQAIAFCGDDINTQTVLDMLGAIDKEYGFQLLDAIISENAQTLLEVINKIAQFAPDYDELLADWLSLLHQIAVTQATGGSSETRIATLAHEISRADIQLYYQLTMHARKDLSFAPNPRQGFEMAMLRILAFKPQTGAAVSNSSKPLSTGSSQQETTEKKTLEFSQPLKADIVQKSSVVVERRVEEVVSEVAELIPTDSNKSEPSTEFHTAESLTIKEPVTKSTQELTTHTPANVVHRSIESIQQEPIVNSASADDELQNDIVELSSLIKTLPPISERIALEFIDENNWHQIAAGLTLEGHGLQILLNAIGFNQNSELRIDYHQRMGSLLTANAEQNIIENLRQYFDDGDLKIIFNPVEETTETPRERASRLHEIAIDEAHQKLLADKQMKYLMTSLDASLARESIRFV